MKVLAIACFILLAACTPRHQAPAAPAAPVPPSPEQMQQYMAEAGAVGEQHKVLKSLVGNWKAETRFWMDPEGKPEVSKGVAKGTLLYGGRFLQMTYKGKAMGMPFEGQSIMGYDNVSRKFFSTWIDSMNTGMVKSEGQIDETAKNITLNATYTCPMTRETLVGEDLFTILDKNHFRYQMFQVKNGARVKTLEINYTRVK